MKRAFSIARKAMSGLARLPSPAEERDWCLAEAQSCEWQAEAFFRRGQHGQAREWYGQADRWRRQAAEIEEGRK